MSVSALILERFDNDDAPRAPIPPSPAGGDIASQRARAEAFAEGYAAGQAAASARADEGEQFLTGAARALEAEAAKARAHAALDAAKALEAMLHAILPALSEAGFAAEAASALQQALAAAPRGEIALSAAPDRAPALEKALAGAGAFSVRSDPMLRGGATRAEWPGGGVDVDVDKAAANCLVALSAAIAKLENGKAS